MCKSVLFIDSISIVNGQARISRSVFNILNQSFFVYLVDVGFFCSSLSLPRLLKRFLGRTFSLVKIFYALFFRLYNFDYVYFVPSRDRLNHLFDVSLLLFILARYSFSNRPKVFAHIHGSDYDAMLSFYPLFYKKLLFRLFLLADVTCILLSPSHSNYFHGGSYPKFVVINNFVDPDYSSSLLKEPPARPSPDHEIVFTHISIPHVDKGLFALLESLLSYLSKDSVCDSVFRLHVIGWSYLDFVNLSCSSISLRQLRSSIDSLVSSSRLLINWHGFLEHDSKWSLLLSSHCLFLLSSFSSEAVPLVVLEGCHAGMQVYLSNHRMLPDLFHLESVHHFLSIESVLSDIESVDFLNGFNSISPSYSFSRFRSSILSLFV